MRTSKFDRHKRYRALIIWPVCSAAPPLEPEPFLEFHRAREKGVSVTYLVCFQRVCVTVRKKQRSALSKKFGKSLL